MIGPESPIPGAAHRLFDSIAKPPPFMDGRELCAQADPDSWFPEKGGSAREAKAVCHQCPLEAACLAFALENEQRFGVWGGHTERERRRLLKRRAA